MWAPGSGKFYNNQSLIEIWMWLKSYCLKFYLLSRLQSYNLIVLKIACIYDVYTCIDNDDLPSCCMSKWTILLEQIWMLRSKLRHRMIGTNLHALTWICQWILCTVQSSRSKLTTSGWPRKGRLLSLVDEGWKRLTTVLNFCVFNGPKRIQTPGKLFWDFRAKQPVGQTAEFKFESKCPCR